MSSKTRPGYGTHADYMAQLEGETQARERKISDALQAAFSAFVTQQTVDVIAFADLGVDFLGEAFQDSQRCLNLCL